MLNVYSGNVTTNADGEAVVTLPAYFEALNHDFRYQLTVIGRFARAIVAQEIRDNRFTIKSEEPKVKVSWQVTGVRKDRWADANRIPVEREKTAGEKGRLLHPEVWRGPGKPGGPRDPAPQQGPRADPIRRVSELVPEQQRERVEQLLEALQRGDGLDLEKVRKVMADTRRAALNPGKTDRAQLEEAWRKLEASMQRIR
jgi:hypothetical protein